MKTKKPRRAADKLRPIVLCYTQRTATDCFSACLAGFIDIEQESIPDFSQPDDGHFWSRAQDWLRERGLWALTIPFANLPLYIGSLFIAVGRSPRSGRHAVIMASEDHMHHDPHPSRDGLVGRPETAVFISRIFDAPF